MRARLNSKKTHKKKKQKKKTHTTTEHTNKTHETRVSKSNKTEEEGETLAADFIVGLIKVVGLVPKLSPVDFFTTAVSGFGAITDADLETYQKQHPLVSALLKRKPRNTPNRKLGRSHCQ
jgi:hypothetical protein